MSAAATAAAAAADDDDDENYVELNASESTPPTHISAADTHKQTSDAMRREWNEGSALLLYLQLRLRQMRARGLLITCVCVCVRTILCRHHSFGRRCLRLGARSFDRSLARSFAQTPSSSKGRRQVEHRAKIANR